MSDCPMLISNKLHSFRNFCAQIYKIFMNRQKTLFLLFMFEVGEIWVGICRGIKRSREIFFLVLFCSFLWLKNKRGNA